VQWSDGVKTAERQDKDVSESISVTATFAVNRTEVALSAPIGRVRPALGTPYFYAGTMEPKGRIGAHVVRIVAQRKVDGVWTKYRTVGTTTEKLSSVMTKYVGRFTFWSRGLYRFRAVLSTDTRFGRSAWTFLRTK
jgi:hypothetical protein